MNAIEILGMPAGLISSILFLPQDIKTWQSKSAKDISLLMLTFATVSVTLWLIYGILIKSNPIIFTSATILIFSVAMLYFKFRYNHQ